MPRSGLLVEWRVENLSNRAGSISTYTCDSCGRVATSLREDKLSHCCKKTTQPPVEIATEILIPKSEFGTDFIAVVCRGWVVDILLLSDRTSVYYCAKEVGVQAYVNSLRLVEPQQAKEYIDDQWRDILAGQGFTQRFEMMQFNDDEADETEIWRSRKSDAFVQITINAEGCPVWRCFIHNASSNALADEGNDSAKLLSSLETVGSTEKPAGCMPQNKEQCYDGWSNWATWNVALLIDHSESTLNIKKRLALNALKKGIGVDQLANQFQRMFKKQEDEVRQYHEDNAADARDRRGQYERQQLEGTKLESTGDAHKDNIRDMVEGLVKPFRDQEGTIDWEETMTEVNWREIAWAAAEQEESENKATGKPFNKKAPIPQFNEKDQEFMKSMGIQSR